MEDRLSNLTLERPAGSSVTVPDGRNLAHLLSQVSEILDLKGNANN